MEEIGTYGRETSVLWMRLAFMDEIGTYGNKGHFLWGKKIPAAVTAEPNPLNGKPAQAMVTLPPLATLYFMQET